MIATVGIRPIVKILYAGTLHILNYTKRIGHRYAVFIARISFTWVMYVTHRAGYKMCARIYLNGDGIGRGKHISLFFVLMRGHYDAVLSWPFRQMVTFMLLDQRDGERNNIVDKFRPDPTSSSFKRPTTEMNIASGCPMFASLDVLEGRHSQYVCNDVLIIKIVIDGSVTTSLQAAPILSTSAW